MTSIDKANQSASSARDLAQNSSTTGYKLGQSLASLDARRRSEHRDDDESDDDDDDETGGKIEGVSEGMRYVFQKVNDKRKRLRDAYNDFRHDIGISITRAPNDEAGIYSHERYLSNFLQYLGKIPLAAQTVQQRDQARRAKRDDKDEIVKEMLLRREPEKPKITFATLGSSLHTKIVDKKMLRQDATLCSVSLTGVVFMLIASLLAWEPRLRPSGTLYACVGAPSDYVAGVVSNLMQTSVNALTYAIFFTTILSCVAIVRLYTMIHMQKQIEWCKINGIEIMPRKAAYNFWRTSAPYKLAVEIGLHLLAPYPWYHSLSSVTDVASSDSNAKFLELCMLFRLYTVVRLLHHASPLYQHRHDIVSGSPELKRANFTVRVGDTIKVYANNNTGLVGLLLYAFVTIVGGFAVWVSERDVNNGCLPEVPDAPGIAGLGFNTWFDGIYFMAISVRTIGYGELKPITTVGRILTITFQFMGMATEAFLGSVVINRIAQTKEEKIVSEFLSSYEAWHELRVASALLIQASWKSCLRYNYLHKLVSPDVMQRIFRTAKRRRDFVAKIKASTSAFPMLSYGDMADENAALRLYDTRQRIEQNEMVSSLALKGILSHLRNLEKTSSQTTSIYDEMANAGSVEDPAERVYQRMHYLRPKKVVTDSATLIQKLSRIFNQDLDSSAWAKGSSATKKPPKGMEIEHQFAASKTVIGPSGKERRVPESTGHKANVILEAQKQFRVARLHFKSALAASADHVIDAKLLISFELMVSAARKVKRNSIMTRGLQKVVDVEVDAVDRVINLVMAGSSKDY